MTYRSECRCECHTRPGMVHIAPCCDPDPIKPSGETGMSEPKDDGGLAFPFECQHPHGGTESYYGMSLRDYFAAQSLQAIMSNTETMVVLSRNAQSRGDADGLALTATTAYRMADAMLESRKPK